MRSRWLAVASCLVVALACLPAVDGQAAGVRYSLHIVCEAVSGGAQVSTSTSPGSCPVRAVDGGDLMGDPSVAVDPLRPENLILASLHGQNYPGQGPSPRSRQGQVFTTFTSQDGGLFWTDNPYTPPDDIGPSAYGEHPQVTIDPYGHVFIGSLYALPNGTAWDYVLAAQKFENLDTVDEEQDAFGSGGSYNVQYLTPVQAGNQINQMWFLFNPITDNMTMVWHESLPRPANPPCETDHAYLLGQQGLYVQANPTPDAKVYQESNGRPDLQSEATCPSDPDQRMILAPAPAARPSLLGASPLPGPRYVPAPARAVQDNASADDTRRSTIGVVWTTSSMDTPYYYQDEEDAIQPCSGSTNPVLSFGYLYIGCVVDTSEGEFRWNPATANGTIELFRMDPDGGVPEYMGSAPPMAGTPRLGVRSDGRLALVAAATADGRLTLEAAFGQYDPEDQRIAWGEHLHLGDDVAPADPGVLLTRAAVQDVIYREQSGALHLVLKTTLAYVGQDREDVLDGVGLVPHIRKDIVALSEEHGLLAVLPINIGAIDVRAQDSTILNAPEEAFQDLSDDFLQLPTEAGLTFNGQDLGDLYQREFFVIADYGTVLFAEVKEVTDLRAPGVFPPPPPPAPVASAATTNLAAPVAGVLGAGSVTALLAIHRRKNPLAAFTKGE